MANVDTQQVKDFLKELANIEITMREETWQTKRDKSKEHLEKLLENSKITLDENKTLELFNDIQNKRSNSSATVENAWPIATVVALSIFVVASVLASLLTPVGIILPVLLGVTGFALVFTMAGTLIDQLTKPSLIDEITHMINNASSDQVDGDVASATASVDVDDKSKDQVEQGTGNVYDPHSSSTVSSDDNAGSVQGTVGDGAAHTPAPASTLGASGDSMARRNNIQPGELSSAVFSSIARQPSHAFGPGR